MPANGLTGSTGKSEPNGSASTPTQHTAPPGTWSPDGASRPSSCPIGRYNDEFAQSECKPSPARYYAPFQGMDSPLPCPSAFYCGPATFKPSPCPPSTFSDVAMLQDASECLPCSGGSYCATPGLTAAGSVALGAVPLSPAAPAAHFYPLPLAAAAYPVMHHAHDHAPVPVG